MSTTTPSKEGSQRKPDSDIIPSDPFSRILERERRAREDMIVAEETKILAERIKKCVAEEGVNHYANCQHLTKAYFKRTCPTSLTMKKKDSNSK